MSQGSGLLREVSGPRRRPHTRRSGAVGLASLKWDVRFSPLVVQLPNRDRWKATFAVLSESPFIIVSVPITCMV